MTSYMIHHMVLFSVTLNDPNPYFNFQGHAKDAIIWRWISRKQYGTVTVEDEENSYAMYQMVPCQMAMSDPDLHCVPKKIMWPRLRR